MANRIVLGGALVLALGLAVGCKKNQKSTQPDSEPPPGTKQNLPKNPNPAQGGNTGGSGGGNVGIVPSPVGGGIVTNPGGGGGGGGGAAQAVRKSVVRLKDGLSEMNTLGTVISLMQNDLGRMPTKEQIVAELKQYPKLLTAVNEGAFILTGTNQPGGLWAYEVDSDTKPGIALIGGRATRSTPDELAPYFRKN